MESQPSVRDGNTKELTPHEFIKIITGRNYGYIFSTSHQNANEQEGLRLATERGEPYQVYPIIIPAPQSPSSYDSYSIATNPNYETKTSTPIIYKIIGEVNLAPIVLTQIIYEQSNYSLPKEYFESVIIPRRVNFSSCHFYGSISFYKVQSEHVITFNNFKFFSDTSTNKVALDFNNCKFKEITFNNFLVNESVILNKLSFQSMTAEIILLFNCQLNELVINTNDGNIKEIRIRNCSIKEIIIFGSNPANIFIENLNECEILDIQDYNILVIENVQKTADPRKAPAEIRDISLDFQSYRKEANLIIKNVDIKKLTLTGTITGKAIFRDILVNQINVFDLSNLGDLRFHNLRGIQSFNIDSVSFGKAEFINVSLHNAGSVHIMDSTLYDIILINTVFPKELSSFGKFDYSGKREVFRQLKLASVKQGNTIRELEYKAFEMDSYEKDRYHKKTISDKIILFTNKYSNDHGTSWPRALGGLFTFSFILFVIIKYLTGYSFIIQFGLPDFEFISAYLNFALNPLHEFGKIFGSTEGNGIGLARLLDTLAKIFSGYFLYQFIQAFRKFSK